MANEYKNLFERFESTVEEGISLGRVPFVGEVTVHSVREFYDTDEIACEEQWSNLMDSESISPLVTIEDILNGEDLRYLLEEDALTSFQNGQFKQFKNQIENLNDLDDFLDYLKENSELEEEVKILRWLVLNQI
ncbi:hypothetical protein GA069_16920 [Vibrio parahaemolyticus]|uniref:hypothetical protein n=2 Tax=Vibrio parahaemolyticus TaxID=670 RepID=UPI001D65F59E|nr:hypothetical protein [Vibrio parahaemolyticus]EGQ9131524.1 hypothetical protein [Vibrio parahaemolyticus]EGR3252108.1 hypothetical protein [Vibrio parahaemolyticus]EGR3267882.1 hypothetical protein [Vibrio parahaemolyticus]MCR9802863.1 hypothetical protein [Vibrio parahaemolyticus]HCE4957843.1 hypothetical protein [Vibrio parahaemolyticus]